MIPPRVRMTCGKCDYEFDIELEFREDAIMTIFHWGEIMDCPACDMTYFFSVDGNKKKQFDVPF